VTQGSLNAEVSNMQTRARLYELNDYAGYNTFDESVFNFTL
jgi:methylisocitrate lyase